MKALDIKDLSNHEEILGRNVPILTASTAVAPAQERPISLGRR